METTENTIEPKKLTKPELVRAILKEVTERRAVIANAEKQNYITDGLFKYGNSSTVPVTDIKTVKHVNQLRDILSFLLSKESYESKANSILGIKDSVYTWNGATISEWTNDLQLRKSILNITSERDMLQKAEEKLMLIDPSLREELELEELRKAFLG